MPIQGHVLLKPILGHLYRIQHLVRSIQCTCKKCGHAMLITSALYHIGSGITSVLMCLFQVVHAGELQHSNMETKVSGPDARSYLAFLKGPKRYFSLLRNAK